MSIHFWHFQVHERVLMKYSSMFTCARVLIRALVDLALCVYGYICYIHAIPKVSLKSNPTADSFTFNLDPAIYILTMWKQIISFHMLL